MIKHSTKRHEGSVAGDATLLTISKLITTVISLVVVMLLSRFRTLDEYGTYSQMLLVMNLATSLIMLGLPNSISYFLAKTDAIDERQRFLSVYYTASTILTVLCGGIVLALMLPIEAYFNNSAISDYWYFLAVFPWATITVSSIENILVVYGKTRYLLVFRLIHSAFLLCIVGIACGVGMSFATYMIMYTACEAAFALVVYFIVNKVGGKITIAFDKKLIKAIFAFSIPIGLASAMGTLNVELDKLMIGYFFSTEELAVYTNAAKELPVTIIAAALTTALLPRLVQKLSKGKNEEAVNLWGKTIIVSFAIICLLAFGCIVFAPEVITILYSDKYISGANVFRVYCLVLLFRCTYWGIMLNSCGKTRFIFISSVLSLVLNIALNFAFFYAIGMVGCAIATLCSMAVIIIMQLIYTSKVLKVKFSKIIPWLQIFIILVINVIFAVGFFFLDRMIPLEQNVGEVWEALILGACWAILYLLVMFKYIKKMLTLIKHNHNKADENSA